MAEADAALYVEHFRDLVRLYASKPEIKDWKVKILGIFTLLRTVYSKAAEGEDRDLKFDNPKIKAFIVEPPGVLDLFLRISPFVREHRVGKNLNEFVLKLKKEEVGRCTPLAIALNQLMSEEESADPWWDSLTVTVKVLLPSGVELQGNFSENETVYDLRLWVSRRCPGDIVIGDLEMTLDDDTARIKDCNLHRRRLLVKMAGDLGQAKMEEVESRRRAEMELQRRDRDVAFAHKQQQKEAARLAEIKNKEKAVRQFTEDRALAEERARREIRKIASSKTSPGTEGHSSAPLQRRDLTE